MRTLIVTADDFGLTERVSEGILETLRCGLVTSVSAMVCARPATDLLQKHAGDLRGRAGVHLQLTNGTPVLAAEKVPTLVTGGGEFPRSRGQGPARRVEEIEMEWLAQVERFLESGLEPSHLDSHHHVHQEPGAFEAFCRVALRLGAPARACSEPMRDALRARGIACPDQFEGKWTGQDCTADGLLAAVDAAFVRAGGAGVVELGTHPGYADEELRGQSFLVETRERERSVLCDAVLAGRLAGSGITLRGMAACRKGEQT